MHQACFRLRLRRDRGRSSESFPYRILIVDDEPSLREIGKLLLEAQGYEVLCAEDGFEGLIALKKSLPDIIISDLRMPNMNGFEFLCVVRRRFPAIPVIVISSEFTGLSVPESVLADAFFSKGGFRPEELFEKIIDLLHELPTRPRDALTQAIVVLASQYGRYGYRRITALLKRAGWQVGKDRVERIWRR